MNNPLLGAKTSIEGLGVVVDPVGLSSTSVDISWRITALTKDALDNAQELLDRMYCAGKMICLSVRFRPFMPFHQARPNSYQFVSPRLRLRSGSVFTPSFQSWYLPFAAPTLTRMQSATPIQPPTPLSSEKRRILSMISKASRQRPHGKDRYARKRT